MKKLKTIFVTTVVAAALFTVAGATSAAELSGDQPAMTTYVTADPGTGGGGGK